MLFPNCFTDQRFFIVMLPISWVLFCRSATSTTDDNSLLSFALELRRKKCAFMLDPMVESRSLVALRHLSFQSLTTPLLSNCSYCLCRMKVAALHRDDNGPERRRLTHPFFRHGWAEVAQPNRPPGLDGQSSFNWAHQPSPLLTGIRLPARNCTKRKDDNGRVLIEHTRNLLHWHCLHETKMTRSRKRTETFRPATLRFIARSMQMEKMIRSSVFPIRIHRANTTSSSTARHC